MKIAKLWNIEIFIHLSTLITILFFGLEATLLYKATFMESNIWILLLFGGISGCILIISVISHELAHALSARSFGIKIRKIDLNILGGATEIEKDPDSPIREIIMAGLGPLISLILGGIFYGLSLLFLSSFFQGLFYYASIANFGLGIFNLIPAYPVDGGRILRAILWAVKKNYYSATQISSRIGMACGTLLTSLGLASLFFTEQYLIGVWLISMGVIIRKSSKQSFSISRSQELLSQIKIKEILKPLAPKVSSTLKVAEVVQQYFNPYHLSEVIVVKDNEILGFYHVDQVEELNYLQREKSPIEMYYVPMKDILTIKSETTALDMVELLRQKHHKLDLVGVKNGSEHIIGYVSLKDIEIVLNQSLPRSRSSIFAR